MASKRISKCLTRGRIMLASLVVPVVCCRSVRADYAYAWGGNDYGQLGNGKSDPNFPFGNYPTPAPVLNLTGGVTAVSAGVYDGWALQNSAVFRWGDNSTPYTPSTVTGLTSGVMAIAAGDYDELFIQGGALLAAGANTYEEDSLGPIIPGTNLYRVTNMSSGVTAVAAGEYYSLAIKNGAAYAWGANWHGQLGIGSQGSSPVYNPTPIVGLSSGVTAISAGGSEEGVTNHAPDNTFYSNCLAIKDGAVYAWGDNTYGQLGNGTTTSSLVPVPVNGLTSGATAVAAGLGYCLAVENGHVYAWGSNGAGQLGDGTTNPSLTPELIDPADLKNIVSVAVAYGSSYALSSDGTLWDWGNNFSNELGVGSNFQLQYLTPQHVLAPSGYVFTSITGSPDGDFALATLASVPEPSAIAVMLATAGILFLCRRGVEPDRRLMPAKIRSRE